MPRRFRFLVVPVVSCLAVAVPVAVGGSAPASADTAGPTLQVDAGGASHPIDPYVYGMNSYGVDQSLATKLRIPIERWGGDGTTRYNWKQDSSNAGGDWYFVSGSGQSDPTPSAGPDALEEKDKASGGTTDIRSRSSRGSTTPRPRTVRTRHRCTDLSSRWIPTSKPPTAPPAATGTRPPEKRSPTPM